MSHVTVLLIIKQNFTKREILAGSGKGSGERTVNSGLAKRWVEKYPISKGVKEPIRAQENRTQFEPALLT